MRLHTGAKNTGFFPEITKNSMFEKREFCEKWDFENVNFWEKYDFEIVIFVKKWGVEDVNFVKNEDFKM